METTQLVQLFHGVRFVLFGFDSINEHKIRTKLVEGGGVDTGQYCQNCTHVIVDKVVYDDPLCVAARKDCKTVVTGLWVDHSFDAGMLVDATTVMYRPLRDLNGIPGAKSFIICLTGYQRQDREDIMNMVALMGAHFSKPLVANKVTHLICYKFEGEKYELAKRLNKIKLVNHRWLEDCLREWEILPEVDYTTSGYELEMMEAEAKDSEDEVENASLRPYVVENVHRSPINIATSFPETHTSPKIAAEAPHILPDLPQSKIPLNVNATDDKFSVHGEGKRMSPASSLDFGNQNSSILKGTYYSKEIESRYESPDGKNARNDWTSNSRSVDRVPSNERFGAASSSKKTPKRLSGNESGFERDFMGEPKVNNLSSLAQAKRRIGSDYVDTLHLHSGVKLTDFSPPKEIRNGYGSPTLRKINDNVKSCFRKSPSPNSKILGLRSAPSCDGGHETNASRAPFGSGCSNSVFAKVNSAIESHSTDVTIHSSKLTKSPQSGLPISEPTISDCGQHALANEKTSPSFFKSVKTSLSFSSRGPDFNNFVEENSTPVAPITGEPQNGQQDIKGSESNNASLSSSKRLKTSLSSGLDFNNFVKENFTPVANTREPKNDMNDPKGSNSKHEKTSPSSFKQVKTTLSSGLDFNNVDKNSTPVAAITGEVQNDQQVGIGYESNRDPDTNNSNGPSSLNLVEDEKSVTKPLGKKTGSKKTLGTRPKNVSIANQKGSIYLGKNNTSQNNAATCLSGEESDKSPMTKKTQLSSPIVNNEAPTKAVAEHANRSRDNAMPQIESLDDETEAPEEKVEQLCENVVNKQNDNGTQKKSASKQHVSNEAITNIKEMTSEQDQKGNETDNAVDSTTSALVRPSSKVDGLKRKTSKEKKSTKRKVLDVADVVKSDELVNSEEIELENNGGQDKVENKAVTGSKPKHQKVSRKKKLKNSVEEEEKENKPTESGNENDSQAKKHGEQSGPKPKPQKVSRKKKLKNSAEEEKESMPTNSGNENGSQDKKHGEQSVVQSNITQMKVKERDSNCRPNSSKEEGGVANSVKNEPAMFILSGHRLQRKEFQSVIRRLKGKFCRDSHQWSYQATHFIAPDPIRRTEKFFAAAASGRWILKMDYLTACNQAGKFLEEEPYEWYKNGLNEDGAINLEAPRKWRLLRQRTGHGALHGMRILIYGECIAPPLDTLKRVVKAGDGTILATSPPYTRFLNSNVDFAIISPGMPRVDAWVQEFLKHEIPCVVADYLVEYVCKPGYSLNKHVLYNTHGWAEKSFAKLQEIAEEKVVVELTPPDHKDVPCLVCGSRDRGDVMLICGNEDGSKGCGVGCHIDCCDPPFEDIPQDDWFCLECIKSKTRDQSSNKKRKRGTSSLKKRSSK
ncbi:BRCT domain-containing protein At4g02110 [Cannabis sativa]|uniref:BRCT domain-containing protein At4g02110 n=1 Tax=Cannabis sativa TaxID=3483 RepID=UPI0029C9B8CE|nr:BRCT domain-containing protein At4g02110 [Cannabis sativa]